MEGYLGEYIVSYALLVCFSKSQLNDSRHANESRFSSLRTYCDHILQSPVTT